MEKIYTVGQVAKLCGVSARTVSKWVDTGKLRGYRIPGSQDRRIPRSDLARFLECHGFPVDLIGAEEWGVPTVLFVGFSEVEFAAASSRPAIRAVLAANSYAAGIATERDRPLAVVVDMGEMGRVEARAIAAEAESRGVRAIVAGCSREDAERFGLPWAESAAAAVSSLLSGASRKRKPATASAVA